MFHDFGYSEEQRLGRPYDLQLLKRLLPYIRPYRTWLIWAVVLIMIITGLELTMPYITKIAIDRYIVPQASETQGAEIREKERFLEADADSPAISAVAERHPDLFERDGKHWRLPLEGIRKLTAGEIRILRGEDLQGLALAAALFLLVAVLDVVLNFFQVMVMERAGQGVMHDLRMALFAHIQELSVSYFNRTPIARLVTRNTNDIQNMHELFTSVIVFVFKDLFLLAGITALLLSIHWELALICFTVLPVMVAASLYFSRLAREVFRELTVKTSEINARFSETIAGMKVIQLFRKERHNFNRFRVLNHEFYEAGMSQIRVFGVFMPLVDLLASVALALVIYYGGLRVLSEDITLGILVAFISYMRMFFNPIRDLAEKYNILQNAMSSAERIFLIMDTREHLPVHTPSPASDSEANPPAGHIETLEFEDVTHWYVKGETVLEDIVLTVRAGETVAFVGPTGAGKTSVINLITRFYDPPQGVIRLNGTDLKAMEPGRVRSRMALVTQDPFLFSDTVRENIAPGREDLTEAAMDRILEDANCRFIIDRLPEGLSTRLTEGGSTLSSGERQLISVARAIAREPELIILDEATSYIDSETEVKIQAALSNLMHSRTAIIVAHRLSTARHADRIIVLNRGRIIESGSHEALMEMKGFYYRLHQLQNEEGGFTENIRSAVP